MMVNKEIEKKIISDIVKRTKNTNTRISLLQSKGYNVKRCYVKTYNKLLGETAMKRKGVLRIIIGRPQNHWYREVYAIDLPL